MMFEGAEVALPVTFALTTDQLAGDSMSRRRFGSAVRAIAWRWSFRLEPLPRGVLLGRVAYHRAKYGTLGRFDIEVPQLADVAECPAGVRAVGAKGAESLRLAVAMGGRLVIPAGVFVAIAGSRKVYQVRTALDSTAAAPALDVRPPLVEAVNGALDVTPTASVRYTEQSTSRFEIGNAGVVPVTVSVVEAL